VRVLGPHADRISSPCSPFPFPANEGAEGKGGGTRANSDAGREDGGGRARGRVKREIGSDRKGGKHV